MVLECKRVDKSPKVKFLPPPIVTANYKGALPHLESLFAKRRKKKVLAPVPTNIFSFS